MPVHLTVKELIDLGWWTQFCALTGEHHPWAAHTKQNRLKGDTLLPVDENTVRQLLGLLPIAAAAPVEPGADG